MAFARGGRLSSRLMYLLERLGRISALKTCRAFTLIELLVVISIIALLLAILMPALGKAKDHAKKIGCSANLRSLAMAAILYAEDNDGLTPSSTNTWNDSGVIKAGWVGQTSSAARVALDTQIQIYGNGSDEFTGLYKSQLWPYIENTKGWRCPTDPDKAQLRSYGMAGQWWGTHANTNGSIWYDPGRPTIHKKLTSIRKASQSFFFVDQLGYNLDAYFALWYSQAKWWNIPNFNHGGGSVNGFADGHCESYKMDRETVEMAEEGMNNMNNGFRMPQNDVPESEDLKYYQRATWGKVVW